jgi:probable HAF family extracellular repeat protein
MKDLGTLGGTLAFANGINNRGPIAGCVKHSRHTTFHAYLWDKGKLTHFGSLGGNLIEVIGLNEEGEFVGKADLPGSLTYHAFLAKNGVMTDLGTQDGDPFSDAININEKNQIVGYSEDCSGNFGHAFLWENNHMTDLNAFVPAGSLHTLTVATFINDRGQIAAEGMLPNGDQRAVLLIPCDEDHPSIEGCDYSLVDTAQVQSTMASVALAHAAVTQVSLTASEMKYRIPDLVASRNRRFRPRTMK